MRLDCATADDTFALGTRLGRSAGPGTVVALIGDLGAGKTVFARGVGEGLAVRTRVSSPTFVIVQSHTGGRLPLWHADLYRLEDAEEIEQLGLEELIAGDGVVLIEWADRFPELLPADHLRVELHGDGEGREVHLTATGPRAEALGRALVG